MAAPRRGKEISGNLEARAGRIFSPGSGPMVLMGNDTGRNTMRYLLTRMLRDETGGETIEYALIMGLIVVTAIAVIGTVGVKVLARWTSVNSSL